jgi:hypothetical protein
MREVTVTAASSGNTPAVVIDQYLNPASVTYYKTGSGTVQVTVTDPYPVVNQNFTEATFSWVTAPTTAPNAANFLGQPYRAIRLTGGTAGDTLTVVQAGAK